MIAAVNGYALGGGCELALACTIRIASENARFGQPEVKLGIIPGYGGSQRLARVVGEGRAMQLCLTAEQIDAAEAYRIGLVNKVVPVGGALAAAKEMAKAILANGPVACRYVLEAIRRGLEMPLAEGLAYEATLFGLCAATTDMVGRHQVIEVGPMSGLSNVQCWLEDRGLEARPELVDAIFRKAKESDHVLADEEILEVVNRLSPSHEPASASRL